MTPKPKNAQEPAIKEQDGDSQVDEEIQQQLKNLTNNYALTFRQVRDLPTFSEGAIAGYDQLKLKAMI